MLGMLNVHLAPVDTLTVYMQTNRWVIPPNLLPYSIFILKIGERVQCSITQGTSEIMQK